jgi:ATP-dependent helicase HrpB
VKAVVFDEFHERSLDADLCLALAMDVRAALRPDLRLVVMSATLGRVGPATADLLGQNVLETAAPKKRAPLVASEGRAYPVRTEYVGAPGRGRFDLENAVVSAVKRALDEHPGPDGGDVLVFLPGAREINASVSALRGKEPRVHSENVVPLHGGLSREQQGKAFTLAPRGQRRIVISTPIAESSLTIPGVRIVVDSGLRKSPRFDARKGMTRLDVVSVSAASADQRRGRAGRVAPGTCYRLWSETTHAALPADTPPEILSADLAPLALNLAAWGGGALLDDPAAALPWLDPPPEGQMAAARDLLERLGALEKGTGRVTETGKDMARLPAHPRIARMLLWASSRGPESARLACQLAAVLGERDVLRGRDSPVDVRARLGALWDAEASGGAGVGLGMGLGGLGGVGITVEDTFSAPLTPSATTPTRVPIGTKIQSGKKNKKMKGAPRGRPAGGGAAAAVKNANAGASNGTGFSPFSAYDMADVDRAATSEAKSVAEQLLRALGRLAKDDTGAKKKFAVGVGDGDPAGPVFPFLLGEGIDECGALLAMAYPDRVGVKRARGSGAHKLSSGNGAATVPGTDPLASAEVIAVADLVGASGSYGGGGGENARNDRARIAAIVSMTALEPGGCLYDHLCVSRDVVSWATASKAVVCRRQLAVGDATLKESSLGADVDPAAVVSAMLQGVREMGFREALGWSDDTEAWRRRVMWFRSKSLEARPEFEARDIDETDDSLPPDLSDEGLEKTAKTWLAPLLDGVSSKSALRGKIDGNGALRNLVSWNQQKIIDDACPSTFAAPSGSTLKIDYDAPGGSPVVRARIQELFGAASGPWVGADAGTQRWRVNVEVHLLSPASRPVQVTTDLASFWANAYHDVAKEMRGRYPKHFWPEDPATAVATNRAKPRKEKEVSFKGKSKK